MTNHRRQVLRKVRWTLTAVLAGGSLFGACEIRVHDAVVGGTKDYISSLLSSPDALHNLFPYLFPSSGSGSDATTGE